MTSTCCCSFHTYVHALCGVHRSNTLFLELFLVRVCSRSQFVLLMPLRCVQYLSTYVLNHTKF
jgi:hypothetical protein